MGSGLVVFIHEERTVNIMEIGIIDHSLGNIGSLANALRFYNYTVKLVKDKTELNNVDIIFLSGVGRFDTVSDRLKKLGLWSAIDEQVMHFGKPIVGICLGMQLFADYSEEGGRHEGFGWIHGHVEKISYPDVKVPHIGWDDVKYAENNNIFSKMKGNTFYFMHSYHYIPQEKSVIQATTQYGSNEIVVAIGRENIVGFQFHPEKSQRDGLRVLKNVVEGFNVI